MRKGAVLAAILLACGTARAEPQAEVQDGATVDRATQDGGAAVDRATQDGGAVDRATQDGGAVDPATQQDTQALGPKSDAFDRACVDLLHGRMPEGEKAIRALKDACGNLMGGRADERIDAEKQLQAQAAAREQLRQIAEGRVQPGQATGQVQPGQGVKAAFEQAASELTDPRKRSKGIGMRQSGPVGYTLVTNPFGWFNGLGVNAELYGAIRDAPKFSWVAGARYSNTDATNGTASTFGAMGGVDLFIIGHNNEGLRIGPRAELAAGRERFQGSTTFARLGLSGEVGYNFIATNGITGLLAAGLGGRVAGDSKNDDFASFVGGEFGPYLKAGLGYSW